MAEAKQEKMQFSAEISKVLQLMIHSLYTNKDIFLRELISNASDACDKLRYEAQTKPELSKSAPLAITISIDKKARTLTVTDTGIGMNREDLISQLGTIAKSGTQEFLQQLTGDSKKDVALIGQFGVGFYSSFMVATRVAVTSRRAGDKETWRWSSEGNGEFSVEPAESSHPHGTSITLYLKKDEDEYLDKFRLKHIAQTYSDHISFPIHLVDEEGKQDTINTASALWTRNKGDITPEQYKEFYHHVAHAPDEPWMILHNKAEGKIEYTNLLFIPSIRPFDLFHPDRKRRVKLYVKRVFITDEGVDLIPQHLRFLRGIIDSEDLPLNISRETLQKNPVLTKIRESIEKRVLSELKKKAEGDPATYATFWNNFGPVIKEGLCEAIAPKEMMLEVCRFNSALAPDKLGSLDEYIADMKKEQEFIYYLTGERAQALAHSPQLEGFVKRGVNVLLLTDPVDDFWVNVVHEYKGKKLKSVTRAASDLDAIELPKDKEDKKPENSAAENKKIDSLLAYFKITLGDQVRDVRTTSKLADSAVCLAVDEMAMDIRMERFLVENKQLAARAPKILEINPHHPLVLMLAEKLSKGDAGKELEDAAFLLLDQARIQEGEEVGDAASFSRRLSKFLERSLAA